MIPRGVKKKFHLRTVLQKYKMQPCNGKIRIHFYFCATIPLKKWLLTPQVLSDFAQYDTPGRFLQKI